MTEDALWPRASSWLIPDDSKADLGVFGVPAHKTSISKTSAHKTPDAIRKALQRYSTYNWTRRVDIRSITATDFADTLDARNYYSAYSTANDFMPSAAPKKRKQPEKARVAA